MFRAQRKRRGFVIGHGIFRWLEAVHAVAGFAAATVGPRQELTVVRIGLVAVGADIVRDRGLEVSAAMTDVTTALQGACQQAGTSSWSGRTEPRTSFASMWKCCGMIHNLA